MQIKIEHDTQFFTWKTLREETMDVNQRSSLYEKSLEIAINIMSTAYKLYVFIGRSSAIKYKNKCTDIT